MQPRVVFRTHYQADEPALLRVLIRDCSSPIRSSYNESIASKLAQEIQRQGQRFNVAAASYVVDLAHGLDLLNEQNAWTAKGQLLGLLAGTPAATWSEQLELDLPERLAFLRIFLEGDGAAILFLTRHLVEHGSIPNSDDDWNGLAQMLFISVYDEYLKVAGTTADRVALRSEVDRIRKKGYTGKSGSHKLFIHLQTMFRVGLISRVPGSRRRYRADADDAGRLAGLAKSLPGPLELEQAVQEETLLDVSAEALGIPSSAEAPEGATLWTKLAPLYQDVMNTGIPLCSLSTLIDAFQIQQAVSDGQVASHAAIREAIETSQRDRVKDIRFHVDRRGNPAFIKLSDDFLAENATPV